MWPFSNIFSKKASKDTPVKSNDRFLYLNSLNFIGQYNESPNGLFTIAWSDFDQEGNTGGFRFKGEGAYIAFKNNELFLQGRLQRPNDGKIANDGTCIINDWLFGEGLKGVFVAFDPNGNLILNYKFNANLVNNGISVDGRYAVCQCARSDSEDSNVLSFFDFPGSMACFAWLESSFCMI